MLISIYMQKKHFIYIILFMIVNIILGFIIKNSKFDILFFFEFIYSICEICLILFYIIEKYLSKNEKNELNEKNQILMKLIILIICYLIFNSTYIYLL